MVGSSFASSTDPALSCDPAFVNGSSSTPALDNDSTDFPFSTYFNDGTLKDQTPFLFPAIQ